MQQEIDKLLEAIKADYLRINSTPEMIESFNNGLEVIKGRKYIKIIKEHSVWGFIVATDNDAKFNYGDILMAASYKAPARNHARGNIFHGYEIEWTGPVYMGTQAQSTNEAIKALSGLDKV